MAWVESHQSLPGHPKTKRAARLLGIPVPHVVGHLHLLWYWALDYAQDGDLSGFDAADLADAAEWGGDPERFVSALVECRAGGWHGFLEQTDDGRLVIHDWWDYAGKLIAKRQADAERKRAGRRQETAPDPADVPSTADGDPVDVAQADSVANAATPDVRQASGGHPADVPATARVNQPTVTNRNQPTATNRDQPTTEPRARGAPPSSRPPPEPEASPPEVRDGDTPFGLYLTLCEELGADPASVAKSEKSKQLGHAKWLLGQGYDEARVRGCLRYLRSQDWRSSPIDLGTVRSEIGKWELNGSRPTAEPRASPRSRGRSGSLTAQQIAEMALAAEDDR